MAAGGNTGLPNSETLNLVKLDMKREIRSLGDKLMSLKEIFEKTKDNKYVQQINEDAKALIPKYATIIRKLEQAHLQGNKDEAVLLSLSKSVDDVTNAYNKLNEWFVRLMPKKQPAKKKDE